MTEVAGLQGAPNFISLRSAEVILSEVRPVKLNVDALRCVNVFLDELLFDILNTARSLQTERLRDGLLKVLPTSLGKSALLEASVELRAYYERTKAAPTEDDIKADKQAFNVQWAFELLRMKCEAFTTLNDNDENAETERLLAAKLGNDGKNQPPRPALVAPASLYLTAILEHLCEHVLSNVGRVAARDSSRNSATSNDLFVALCEDDSLYPVFKSMKVFEQIETLANMPTTRRSKSFSRPHNSDLIPRTGSPLDPSQRDGYAPTARSSRSRKPSVDSAMIGVLPRRASMEKARAMKMFTNGRSSGEGHTDGTHRKTDSVTSDSFRNFAGASPEYSTDYEDENMLEEFDNAMKSGPTMKMSLTPDRLKTMESFNREKGAIAASRRPPQKPSRKGDTPFDASSLPASPELPSKTAAATQPNEHDDLPPLPNGHRSRQGSLVSRMSKPLAAPRSRAASTSTPPVASSGMLARKASQEPSMSSPTTKARPVPKAIDTSSGMPQKTRTIARNVADMDLDELMGESEDEDEERASGPTSIVSPTPRSVAAPSLASSQSRPRPVGTGVSAGTRELMDFLSSGPPDDGMPANDSVTSLEGTKKGSGRLQRMMSKLKLNTPSTSPVKPTLATKKSTGNLILANKPVPPRPPPRMPSPSSSPSTPSPEPSAANFTPTRSPRKAPPAWSDSSTQLASTHKEPSGGTQDTMSSRASSKAPSANGHPERSLSKDDARTERTPISPRSVRNHRLQPPADEQTLSSKMSSERASPVPSAVPSDYKPSVEDANVIRRLLSHATTADECRLLMDIFFAKHGITSENGTTDPREAYPSPTLTDRSLTHQSPEDRNLQHSLVEVLLANNNPVIHQTEPSDSALSSGVKDAVDVPGVNNHVPAIRAIPSAA